MYLRRFLPHMDDAQIEEFIRGSDGSEGFRWRTNYDWAVVETMQVKNSI